MNLGVPKLEYASESPGRLARAQTVGSDLAAWSGPQGSVAPTSALVMQTLLLWGPDLEKH